MPTQVSKAPSLPEEDLALREACKDSLATFAECFGRNYRAARVHELIAAKLEDCLARKVRRLCISCPPRLGKSLLCSVMLPAWALTKNPSLNVIQASYGADLAEGFSLSVKRVLESEPYRALFPPVLASDLNRQRSWVTLAGGQYFAVGLGGGVVGRSADLFVCDDLIRDRAEANSEANRNRIWEWFMGSAMTRLSPNGVMIVVNSRWHQGDLIGRLIDPERAQQFQDAGISGEDFEFLNLPALCENPDIDPLGRSFGEALWPEQWPVQRLEARKLQIGEMEFAAQYQGRPNPAGGGVFKIDRIRIIDREAVPADIRLVRAWDLAISTKSSADYSVGAYGGQDAAGNFYLLHVDRAKRSWPDQKRRILQLAEIEARGREIAVETVGGWKIAQDELAAMLRGQTVVKAITPDKDKLARAQPWAAKVDGGMFFIVRGTWNADFLSELEQFPNGMHDDQIDAVSILWECTRKIDRLLC